jgi:hypothetical protein
MVSLCATTAFAVPPAVPYQSDEQGRLIPSVGRILYSSDKIGEIALHFHDDSCGHPNPNHIDINDLPNIAEDFYVTHFIQTPVIYEFDEPVTVETFVIFQDALLEELVELEEMANPICAKCDMGAVSWVRQSLGTKYRGPEHACGHGYPRGTDDTWYRADQWAQKCNRCGWIYSLEDRLEQLSEDCYGRN